MMIYALVRVPAGGQQANVVPVVENGPVVLPVDFYEKRLSSL